MTTAFDTFGPDEMAAAVTSEEEAFTLVRRLTSRFQWATRIVTRGDVADKWVDLMHDRTGSYPDPGDMPVAIFGIVEASAQYGRLAELTSDDWNALACAVEDAIDEFDDTLDAEDRYKPFVIVSIDKVEDDGTPLYWSNRDGWVDLDSATGFTLIEVEHLDPVIGGAWLRRSTAEDRR